MNEEVRKAVERMWLNSRVNQGDDIAVIRAELTRLTEIAESVDPLVVRLGEVTTRLEAADALLRDTLHQWPRLSCDAFHHSKAEQHSAVDECEPLRRWRALYSAIDARLSEPRT
jgi:hypothetical protein